MGYLENLQLQFRSLVRLRFGKPLRFGTTGEALRWTIEEEISGDMAGLLRQ
jgi:hypothetical protein